MPTCVRPILDAPELVLDGERCMSTRSSYQSFDDRWGERSFLIPSGLFQDSSACSSSRFDSGSASGTHRSAAQSRQVAKIDLAALFTSATFRDGLLDGPIIEVVLNELGEGL